MKLVCAVRRYAYYLFPYFIFLFSIWIWIRIRICGQQCTDYPHTAVIFHMHLLMYYYDHNRCNK